MAKYEYKFVRLGESWWSATREAQRSYREIIEQHAREGWRLVQVFAPGLGIHGTARFFEIILEREA